MTRLFPKGTGWVVRQALGRAGLLDVLMPRRFHAYGTGLGKSGTHSVSHIFNNYRRAHEPDGARYRAMILAYKMTGEMTTEQFRRELRKRDRRLWLEMDAWNLYGEVPADLVAAFPEAKFIHTIREPFDWADSYMNHDLNRHLKGGATDIVAPIRQYVWQLDAIAFTRFDGPLEARGLYPLECYFRHWATHNRRVLDNVPEDRLLVLRIGDLRDRLGDIAAFVGVPVETLDPGQVWSYRAPKKHGVLAELDPAYVRETAEKYVPNLVDRFFPDLAPYGTGRVASAKALP